MRSHSRFQYPEDAPAAMATGMAEVGAETWERLAELLASELAALIQLRRPRPSRRNTRRARRPPRTGGRIRVRSLAVRRPA